MLKVTTDNVMVGHLQNCHDLMDRRLKTLFSKFLPLRAFTTQPASIVSEFVVKYSRVIKDISFITIRLLQCYEKFLSGWSYCPAFALPNATTYEKISVYNIYAVSFPFKDTCLLSYIIIKNDIFSSFRLNRIVSRYILSFN